MPQLSLHSPVGDLTLSEEDDALVAVDWGWGRDQTRTATLIEAVAQLHRYFDGQLHRFTIPIRPKGIGYRQLAWAGACKIPFGATWTYARLAAEVGGSARAAGAAMAANPLPILIPCHRVVAAAGAGGYSGGDGLATKQALLELERISAEHGTTARSVPDRPLKEERPA